MNDITIRKMVALKSILKSFRDYRDGNKSRLEMTIVKLKDKLSSHEYNELLQGLKSYDDNILYVFAHTSKVFVKLNDIDNLENIFKDID